MREILKNIYQIDVSLPKSPLKMIHAYLIKGQERNLLIDAGFNDPKSIEDLKNGLNELNVSLDNTDIFITHLHSDHAGMVCSLLTENNEVFASEKDAMLMNLIATKEYKNVIIKNLDLTFTPEDRRLDYRVHPAIAFGMSREVDFTIVKPGDTFVIGDYKFEIIDLAGHTPGQIGLYEKNRKILFCGDHVINKITPNIIYWGDDFDSIKVFMDNLEKVKGMDIDVIYSAHRDDIINPKERVQALIDHHHKRLAEVCMIAKDEPKTVYEIAQKMTWEFGGGDFNTFAVQQVWFAVSEAFSHAEHLVNINKLKKIQENNIIKYKAI